MNFPKEVLQQWIPSGENFRDKDWQKTEMSTYWGYKKLYCADVIRQTTWMTMSGQGTPMAQPHRPEYPLERTVCLVHTMIIVLSRKNLFPAGLWPSKWAPKRAWEALYLFIPLRAWVIQLICPSFYYCQTLLSLYSVYFNSIYWAFTVCQAWDIQIEESSL